MDNTKTKRNDKFFHIKSGILFQWQDDIKSYEPIGFNGVVKEDGSVSYIKIKKNSLLYEYIAFIRYSSPIINKQTGKAESGKLETYQWDISFKIIQAAMSLNSMDTMCSISRQAGKSYVARKVLAFLLIFGAHHLGNRLREDRFYLTLAGVKKDMVEDHCKKMQVDIDYAIELFNKLRPDSPIVTPDQNGDLSDKVTKKQYNRIVNGIEITYSAFDAISLSASVNAGRRQ